MDDNDIAPHFAPLLALLETVVAQRDYDNPALVAMVAQGAAAARAAGVPPERVLAYLRTSLHATPLIAVGDWYRGVLVDRMVLRAIEAWYSGGSDPNESVNQPGASG